MSHLNNDVLNEFFKGGYVKGLVKKASQKKQAFDQDSYYEPALQGPTVPDEIAVAHPGGGTTTQVANSGGGDVGVYDVGMSDVGASGPCADAHFETITEVAPYHEEVARKEPTGVQGSRVKGIARRASTNLLHKLAQVATELDEKGLTDEAAQIDQIIAEEVGVDLEEVAAEEATQTETEEAPQASENPQSA